MSEKNPTTIDDTTLGEYVLGTLNDAEKQIVETALEKDPALMKKVYAWEQQLQSLAETTHQVEPPKHLKKKIMSRIDNHQAASVQTSWWDNISFWRNASMITTFSALALVVVLTVNDPQSPSFKQIAVVMNAQLPGWTIATDDRQDFLQIQAIQPAAMPAGKVCQIWVGKGEQRYSVGILPDKGSSRLKLQRNISPNEIITITIEPENGLHDQPTGEVVFSGTLTSI
jgi:anti-sigma-K factor RskA